MELEALTAQWNDLTKLPTAASPRSGPKAADAATAAQPSLDVMLAEINCRQEILVSSAAPDIRDMDESSDRFMTHTLHSGENFDCCPPPSTELSWVPSGDHVMTCKLNVTIKDSLRMVMECIPMVLEDFYLLRGCPDYTTNI